MPDEARSWVDWWTEIRALTHLCPVVWGVYRRAGMFAKPPPTLSLLPPLPALLGSLAYSLLALGCTGEEDAAAHGQETGVCTRPTSVDHAHAEAAYAHWKETLLSSEGAGGHLRVVRPNSKGAIPYSTVSEGIAYGMLMAVYMDDQHTFDELWKYSQLHTEPSGLMNWYIDPEGQVAEGGEGGATDADEDIAFALVMADRKWGGGGSLDKTYIELARYQIDLVFNYEIEWGTWVVKPGSTWGGSEVTNISYFAPAFYKTFAEVTGEDRWYRVIDRSYAVIDASLREELGNHDNGLVPAWCDMHGTPSSAESGHPTHFQFDSCRTPFRIGQDWCWHGEPRAREYLEKITSFYESIGLENLIDGYDLDGTPRPEFSENGSRAAAFVGPAGVGAMHDPAHQAFVDGAYEDLYTPDRLIVGDADYDNAGSIYYNTSWRVLSLLMLDGTFRDFTLGE